MAEQDGRVRFITGSTSGFGRALVDAAVERFGRIDALVNSAGIGFVGALEEMPVRGARGRDRAVRRARADRRAGNFRTGLVGQSMHTAAPMEAYATTVGVTRSYFAGKDGRQSGDPAKAAAAIMTALDADEPPLRPRMGRRCPGQRTVRLLLDA